MYTDSDKKLVMISPVRSPLNGGRKKENTDKRAIRTPGMTRLKR